MQHAYTTCDCHHKINRVTCNGPEAHNRNPDSHASRRRPDVHHTPCILWRAAGAAVTPSHLHATLASLAFGRKANLEAVLYRRCFSDDLGFWIKPTDEHRPARACSFVFAPARAHLPCRCCKTHPEQPVRAAGSYSVMRSSSSSVQFGLFTHFFERKRIATGETRCAHW
jgi:hypothetical protein